MNIKDESDLLDEIYFNIYISQQHALQILKTYNLNFADYFPFNEEYEQLKQECKLAIHVLIQSITLKIYIEENGEMVKIFQVHAKLFTNFSTMLLASLLDDAQRGIDIKISRKRGTRKSSLTRKKAASERDQKIIKAANKLLAEGVDKRSIAGKLQKKSDVKIDTIRRALKNNNFH